MKKNPWKIALAVTSVVLIICIILALAYFHKNTQVQLTKEQASQLEAQFDFALKDADFQWDDTPKYIPRILAVDGAVHLRVSIDTISKQKTLSIEPAQGNETLTIDNYEFSLCAISYGLDEEVRQEIDSATEFEKHMINGIECWFAEGYAKEKSCLLVNLMYFIDENTACFVAVYVKNETKLTKGFMRKMMDDFSCVVF
jgi:hypothetical protein